MLEALCPGMDHESVDVTVVGDVVTIRGQRKADVETAQGQYQRGGRRVGGDGWNQRFSRTAGDNRETRLPPQRAHRSRNGVVSSVCRSASLFVHAMKIAVSWSTGKDSAWTLHTLARQHPGCTAGLVTTINEAFDRVAMHAVPRALVHAQAAALGLPLYAIDLPWPCSNAEYESRMADAVRRLEDDGFTHMAFGDLFLADVRRYREERLAGTRLKPLFPLWKAQPTRELAQAMIDAGVRACLTCIDPRVLPPSFAGRLFDEALIADLPDGVDPCGENGEFHTFVSDGPMFSRPVAVSTGQRVERDGFVFADLIPHHAPSPPHEPASSSARCFRAGSSV